MPSTNYLLYNEGFSVCYLEKWAADILIHHVLQTALQRGNPHNQCSHFPASHTQLASLIHYFVSVSRWVCVLITCSVCSALWKSRRKEARLNLYMLLILDRSVITKYILLAVSASGRYASLPTDTQRDWCYTGATCCFIDSWYLVHNHTLSQHHLVEWRLQAVRFSQRLVDQSAAGFGLVQRLNQLLILQDIPLSSCQRLYTHKTHSLLRLWRKTCSKRACWDRCFSTSSSDSSSWASWIFFSSSCCRSFVFSLSSSGFSCWMVNASS